MRLLGKIAKGEIEKPSIVHPPLADLVVSEPSDTPDTPSTPPSICPGCLGNYWWEDIGRRMHCCFCQPSPSIRMIRDFWLAIPADHPNADGSWEAVGWRHWQPFAPNRWGVRSKVLAHLEAPREVAAADAAVDDGF